MSKATATAYAIQGLIKYHGMKNWELRLPYHNSISVCMNRLKTTTTVELNPKLENDLFLINDEKLEGRELERMLAIVNRVRGLDKERGLKNYKTKVKVVSENKIGRAEHNYEEKGKGLGYSSSGGAALTLASVAAFGLKDLEDDYKVLSTIARRLAGSAARSIVGGFAEWYAAEKDEESYAGQLAGRRDFPDWKTLVYFIPESHALKTEDAHREIVTSPLFECRLKYIEGALTEMEKAISTRDMEKIGMLAEKDSLILHATTMTGENNLVAWEPKSIEIFKKVRILRETEKVPAYTSFDTGPSVFVNTQTNYVEKIKTGLEKIFPENPIICEVGDQAKLTENHLF